MDMLTKKYRNEFIQGVSMVDIQHFVPCSNKIIEFEEQKQISILEWNEDIFKEFMLSIESKGQSFLFRAKKCLNDFMAFIAEKEGVIAPIFTVLDGEMVNYIAQDEVLEVTISFDDYKNIIPQIINVRDRVLVELGWLPMQADDIQHLKVTDIESIYKDEIVVALTLHGKSKDYIVEDNNIIKDIQECVRCTEYIDSTKNSVPKIYALRDTPYLLKTVNVGRSSESKYLKYPYKALHAALSDVKISGVNIKDLTFDDLKRSKIVYLLSQGFSPAKIAEKYGIILQTVRNLRYLVDLKYPKG